MSSLFSNILPQQPVYQVPPQQYYQAPQQQYYQVPQQQYGQDAFGSSLNQLATSVYQLQQSVTSAGASAYGNYQLTQSCNDMITRLTQYQSALSSSGAYANSQYQTTINDLGQRLTAIQRILATPAQQYPQQVPGYPYPQQQYPYPQQQYPQQQRPIPPGMHRPHRHHRRPWNQNQVLGQNNPVGQIFQQFGNMVNQLQQQQQYYRR